MTTSRIGNLTRLIHTLLYVMTIHTYIHTHILYISMFAITNFFPFFHSRVQSPVATEVEKKRKKLVMARRGGLRRSLSLPEKEAREPKTYIL